MKHCRQCNKIQPSQAFGSNRSKPDGLSDECLRCMRTNHKRRRWLATGAVTTPEDRIERVRSSPEARRIRRSQARKVGKEGRTDYRLVQLAKARAARKQIPFALTEADILIPERCPVLGIELKPGTKHLCDTSPTLDRIDNAKGYVPDNVIVVSYKANRMKSNATVEELERVASFYRSLEAA